MVTLRRLLKTDGDALAEFYEAVPLSDQRFYCPHPLDRENALRNASRADDPGRITLIAEIPDGKIVGYAWVRRKDQTAETGNFGICFRPEYQGSGAGRALMTLLFKNVREYGPRIVRLTVQKDNDRGVVLYQKLGFQIVEERWRGPVAHLGLPAELEYVMEWRLPEKNRGM